MLNLFNLYGNKKHKWHTLVFLSGPEGRGRTDMILLSQDFESCASAISPLRDILEAPTRFELVSEGFADLCLTTWRWCHIVLKTLLVYMKN